MSHTFRAIWPITDHGMSADEMTSQALDDLPALLLQSRARVTGRGQFRVAPGNAVPGSRGAERVLIYDAPAQPLPVRSYWKKEKR